MRVLGQDSEGQLAQEVLLNLGNSIVEEQDIEQLSPTQASWYIHKRVLFVLAEITNGNPFGGKNIYQRHKFCSKIIINRIN